jgi:TonB family protein
MQPAAEPVRRRRRAVSLSFALHAAALALLLVIGAAPRIIPPPVPDHFDHIARIDIAGASHHVKVPLPPLPYAAHTLHPVPDQDSSKRTILPVDMPQPRRSGGGAPTVPHHSDGSNTALRGNGADAQDVRPAFPVFSPQPPVTDRSLLPSTEQKIVVDVNVDALGDVVSESLVKGLGNRLDQVVLDIVKTWRFHPATVDGKPVPAQAELIFPFDQRYPVADS